MKNRMHAGGGRSNERKVSHFFLSSYGKSDNSLFTDSILSEHAHSNCAS